MGSGEPARQLCSAQLSEGEILEIARQTLREEAVLHARFAHDNLGRSPAVKANASPLTRVPCSLLRSFTKHWGPEMLPKVVRLMFSYLLLLAWQFPNLFLGPE